MFDPELSTRITYRHQNYLHSLERCRGIVMIVKLFFIPRLCFTPTILHFRDTYVLPSSHVSSSKQRHSVLFLLFLFLVAIYFISRCYLLFLVASAPVLLQRSHRYSSHTCAIEFLLHSTSTRRNCIQIIYRIFLHLSLNQLSIRTVFVFMTIYCLLSSVSTRFRSWISKHTQTRVYLFLIRSLFAGFHVSKFSNTWDMDIP